MRNDKWVDRSAAKRGVDDRYESSVLLAWLAGRSSCVGLGETRQAGTALATPLRRGRKGGYAHSVPDQRAPESRSGGV